MSDITPHPDLAAVRQYIRDSGVTYEDWARLSGSRYWQVAKFMTSRNPTTAVFFRIKDAVRRHQAGGVAA
jgi:hypothetical protein